MLAGMYMGYVIIRAIMDPSVAPKLPLEQRKVSTAAVLTSLAVNFFPLFLLIAFVLGAIIRARRDARVRGRGGGSAGLHLLAFAYRLIGANGFGFKQVKESTFLTARASAMVCWLFVRRIAVFSAVFAYLGGQKVVEDFVPVAEPQRILLPHPDAGHHLRVGLAAEWTEIIVIFPADLPAAAR